jgi:hypothetical protein
MGAMVLVMVSAAAFSAAAQLAEPGPFDHSPVVPEIAVQGAETAGGTVTVTLAVMARVAQADAQLRIELPQGVTLEKGAAEWRGEMAAGQVQIVEISAKLMKPGVHQIVGRVTLDGSGAGDGAGDGPAPTVLTVERVIEVKGAASPSKPRK